MTRKLQKSVERHWIETADKMLGAKWLISDNEAPDFVIEENGALYGVEVTEAFIDNGKDKHSTTRQIESISNKQLRTLIAMYYDGGGLPMRVNLLNYPAITKSDLEQLYRVLNSRERRSDYEDERIEVGDNGIIYVMDLPLEFGRYAHWTNVSHTCGFVAPMTVQRMQGVIDAKADKIIKYQEGYKNIILLVVANRTNNSGKLEYAIEGDLNGRGFSRIYLLTYPMRIQLIYGDSA